MSQLALPLKLQDHAIFDTFWGAGNENLLAFVEGLCVSGQGPGCWIRGAAATGKSHLLQAVCARIGPPAVYLPMAELGPMGAGVLEGMAERGFVCIDDVHAVAGDADWEAGLFRLFDAASECRGVLIVAARMPPRGAGFGLADLESRFTMLPTFLLRPLNDVERLAALQLRARHRGLALPDETAQYLMKRQRRDMASLYGLLDRLDDEALAAQRRLTIPFVKSVLEG